MTPSERIKLWKGLNERQQQFLRACRDRPTKIDQLIQDFGLRPHTLSRWLRRERFRTALAGVLTEVRVRTRLAVVLSAANAAHRLEQIASGEVRDATPQEIAGLKQIVKLPYLIWPRRRRRRGSRTAAAVTRPTILTRDGPRLTRYTDHQKRQLLDQLRDARNHPDEEGPASTVAAVEPRPLVVPSPGIPGEG